MSAFVDLFSVCVCVCVGGCGCGCGWLGVYAYYCMFICLHRACMSMFIDVHSCVW